MSYRKENDPAGAIRGDGRPTTPPDIAPEADRPLGQTHRARSGTAPTGLPPS